MAILVTNDDGIYAPGLAALANGLRDIGDVVVVAPDREQSAVGHSITLSGPLRITEIERGNKNIGYSCNGTPADAVKLAIKVIMPEPPELVVSGINMGANVGASLIYSGTVSAATEGTLLGIPSIAVSLDNRMGGDWDLAVRFTKKVARMVLEKGLPTGVLLNINIPDLPEKKIAGIKITQQGKTNFNDFFEKREDPRGQPYYWMCGTMESDANKPEHDITALKSGFITVTPVHYDLTAYEFLEELANWALSDLRGE
ncbi:5'/3'-nucleotidase SurE [bacterium]|nr:MAG: 5'/3'-nucleotidase SurE [bacterium]